MSSLISIMLPCYNSVDTLPFAIASILAQEYQSWECILVDDGSEDYPEKVIEKCNDKRIKFVKLKRNYGRGVARQIALDIAEGDYLCMLDADDWWYPEKLSTQLAIMEQMESVAILSNGMAVVDKQCELTAISRAVSEAHPVRRFDPLPSLSSVPFAHAPSIIRMPIAKKLKYDHSLRRSQDADFLLQIILSHEYAISSKVLYVYSEGASFTRQKLAEAYRYRMKMLLKYRDKYPVKAVFQTGISGVKSVLYQVLFVLGRSDWIKATRFQKPSSEDMLDFQRAYQIVKRCKESTFCE